jgi:hypothetical protein
MTGVIDLIFRRQGRYYILDWKTNWLQNYGSDAMREEMEANGYFLQAALYAGAVSRWLRLHSLPPDSFGGVLYLFVRAFTDEPYREAFAGSEEESEGAGVLFLDSAELVQLAHKYRIEAAL